MTDRVEWQRVIQSARDTGTDEPLMLEVHCVNGLAGFIRLTSAKCDRLLAWHANRDVAITHAVRLADHWSPEAFRKMPGLDLLKAAPFPEDKP